MNEITAISQITAQDVADYLRIAELTEDNEAYIDTIIPVAKSFICNYTGLKSEELDSYQDLIIVVYVLCQDMYDNRTNYVDSDKPNRVVECILNLHQRNLL